jgi:hypothetical protein
MSLTFPKWGLGSLLRLSKLQNLIAGVKTPHIGVFFISLENYWNYRCRKWARMGHLDICNTRYGKKKGQKSNWQFDFWSLKVGNQPNPGACRWSVIHCWKALEESYKFSLDLIPIRGLRKKLWPLKVVGVQIRIVLGLLLGSPGTKNHSDVGVVERRKEYYMGEGGGFPWVRSMVSLVSPKLPMACLSIKGAPKNDLTNLLIGLMQVQIGN